MEEVWLSLRGRGLVESCSGRDVLRRGKGVVGSRGKIKATLH